MQTPPTHVALKDSSDQDRAVSLRYEVATTLLNAIQYSVASFRLPQDSPSFFCASSAQHDTFVSRQIVIVASYIIALLSTSHKNYR